MGLWHSAFYRDYTPINLTSEAIKATHHSYVFVCIGSDSAFSGGVGYHRGALSLKPSAVSKDATIS